MSPIFPAPKHSPEKTTPLSLKDQKDNRLVTKRPKRQLACHSAFANLLTLPSISNQRNPGLGYFRHQNISLKQLPCHSPFANLVSHRRQTKSSSSSLSPKHFPKTTFMSLKDNSPVSHHLQTLSLLPFTFNTIIIIIENKT